MSQSSSETGVDARFAFGANWKRFLATVDDDSIRVAENSLRDMLGVADLGHKSFLDIGCGAGLLGLAARRLGALVYCFDFDPESVNCTRQIANHYRPADREWRIESGSILDHEYVASLGTFDVVYAWGVLHHTGRMWEALGNAIDLVAPGGQLFVAIYNDQGALSRYWLTVKRLYHSAPVSRGVVVAVHLPYLFLARYAVRALTGRLDLERGMSLWHDMIDWLGGMPFEVARPERVTEFVERRGFRIERLDRVKGNRSGCNQFVFRRLGATASPPPA